MNYTKDSVVIKNIRKKYNISQKELSLKIIFLNQSQICKIEKGDRKLKVEEVFKIAKALDITVQELFLDEE